MKKPELLAPAKSIETGKTAIQCGADAVYIGADKFGARASAGNSIKDIHNLIKFAHKYGSKVYVTINTILTDPEIIEARDLIHTLYEIGTDAIIIQDMGLLELDLPPLPLFASTQTHNTNWQKVNFLEKTGFQRVILARELSLEQIREIREKTNIELEFFVHGALCVSYSGQCYLSYINGGRSGNRGMCAQPCRKKYTLKDSGGKILAKDKYLLSLKDLNLSEHLDDLVKAGISSFKIEGRLKDIDYVRNIVSYYRHKIDKSLPDFRFNPDKTFNRGYTSYFLLGRTGDITSFDTPKHVGEPMGLIETVKLNNGDGITYFDKNKVLQGTNRPSTVEKGTFVYRNFDHEYLKQLSSLKIDRKIKIKINFNNKFLELMDNDGNLARQEIDENFEPANNPEMALKNIEKQLLKLGKTIFYAEEVSFSLNPVPFIPVSVLNEARRKAVDKLEQLRIKNFPRKTCVIQPNNFPYPDKTLGYSGNVLNKYAKQFYLRHGVENIDPAAESGADIAGKKLMTTKLCLKYQFDLCGKSDESLYLTEEYNTYRLEFNCEKCEMSLFLSNIKDL